MSAIIQRHNLSPSAPLKLLGGTAAYFVAAKVGLVFALPVGYASLIWPATSVALFLTLRRGVFGGIGCAIGAFAAFATYTPSALFCPVHLEALLPPLAVSIAALLQAVIGAELVARYVCGAPDETSASWFFGRAASIATPLALIRSTFTTIVLFRFNLLSDVSPGLLWLTITLSDLLALMMAAPLALLVSNSPWARLRADRDFRFMFWALVGIIVTGWLTAEAFFVSDSSELRKSFAEQSRDLIASVKAKAADDALLLNSLRSLVDADPALSRPEFADFSSILLLARPQIDGIGLIRRIESSQRAAFETSRSRDAGRPIRITALGPNGLEPSGNHPGFYYPVDYAEPGDSAFAAEGFDVSSDPVRKQVLDLAAHTGLPAASGLLNLVGVQSRIKAVVVVLPFHEHPGERSLDSIRGFVTIRFQMEQWMSQMLRQAGSLMQTATISVEDRTNGATTTLVQVHAGVPLAGPTPELSKDFIISDDVDMEGRRWHVSTGLTAGIASSAFGRGVWLRQIAPQFTAAFLASLLLLRMRQNRARDRFDLQVVALSRNFLGATNAASRVSGTSGLTASGSNDGIADEHFDAVCREIWESGQTQQYFEPVINLRTGDLVGFESLLRIRGRSDTPPIYKFIEWAERAGHIRELTRRSVAQAFDQIERFQQQSGTLEVPWISVNISATDLGDDEFVSRVVALTHVHPKTQGYIKLEITESVLLVDIEHTVQRLQLLRSAGLRIALDDFGTGYASLSYLRQLPIDTLKIDRSFISPVGTDTTAREIVKALVALAGKLNLDVIAEGIEDAATASAVLRLGCKQAQGYLFPRAAPADTVVVWVTRRHRFLASILSGSPSSGRIEPQRNSTPSTET